FTESFNGRMRDELLNETLFMSMGHAREEIAAWAGDYNGRRPHSSLAVRTRGSGVFRQPAGDDEEHEFGNRNGA
ncbi:MAG TPA: transposase, partial [Devosia sp.]|nr:transposase [Devosia sp.]